MNRVVRPGLLPSVTMACVFLPNNERSEAIASG